MFAAVPQSINYTGVLESKPGGSPITDTLDFVVRIFNAATTGTELYSESHAGVLVDAGVFSLAIGTGSTPTGAFGFPTFASNTTWLELVVDGETQTPRMALMSVPYALIAEQADNATNAINANNLAGVVAGNYALSSDLVPSGNTTGDSLNWDGGNWVAVTPPAPVPENNIQPSTVINYIIAVFGFFPSPTSANPFLGEIIMFAGNFAPNGWALCDGQLLPISQNQALFSILGTTYGGDGETILALPDLRGRVLMHAGSGPGLSTRPLGQRLGTETN